MITPLLRIEVERQRLALQTQRLLAGFESQLEHSLGLEVRRVVVQPGPDTTSFVVTDYHDGLAEVLICEPRGRLLASQCGPYSTFRVSVRPGRDLAAQLAAAIAQGETREVRRLALELEDQLATIGSRRASDEPFDYHLYRAAVWLRAHGEPEIDPEPWLERAYATLLEQTSFLAPADRHHFLFGLPLHREIVEAAAREGLATQGGTHPVRH